MDLAVHARPPSVNRVGGFVNRVGGFGGAGEAACWSGGETGAACWSGGETGAAGTMGWFGGTNDQFGGAEAACWSRATVG